MDFSRPAMNRMAEPVNIAAQTPGRAPDIQPAVFGVGLPGIVCRVRKTPSSVFA